MKKVLIGVLVVLCLSVTPVTAFATIGVGVGTGRIIVQERMKAGEIYRLPTVTVFNTGTQTASYTMEVTLNQAQSQLKPDPAWFSFSPSNFTLQPGQSKVVQPTFRPPLQAPAGSYFAYLEAHPAGTVKQGNAAVGVAAATKLSFKLAPSSLPVALWTRLLALFRYYSPWSYAAAAIALGGGAFIGLKRHFRFSIRITKV